MPRPATCEERRFREEVQALAAAGRLEAALSRVRSRLAQGEGPLGRFLEGVLLGRLGRAEEAERALRRTLALAPNDAEALFALARALEVQGRAGEAAEAYRACAASPGAGAEPWRRRGRLLEALGREAEAAEAYAEALRLAPVDDPLRLALARLLERLGRLGEALPHLEGLAARHPHRWEAHHLLGAALLNAAQPERALPALERAAALAPPEQPQPLAARVKALHMLGRSEEAWEAVRELLRRHPRSWHVLLAHAELAPRFGAAEEAARGLEEAFARGTPPEDLGALARFALARLLDRLGRDPERVLALLGEAHRLAGHRFDRTAHERRLRWTLETFSAEALARCTPRSRGDLGEGLVLVVGMPRSGTTLLERILDAHPQAAGLGERDELQALGRWLRPRLEAGLPLARLLREPAVEEATRTALARLRAAGGGAPVLVDKMPTNFWWLGLAALLFPRARVVHLRRHPLDNVLACHLQYLSGAHGYTGRLEDAALYHRDHLRLMAHWRRAAALPILELRYEALVERLEEEVRRLLEFLGLPWEARCLRFHENRGLARTASYDQVRRPLHREAVGRWRPYRHLLPREVVVPLAPYLHADAPFAYR